MIFTTENPKLFDFEDVREFNVPAFYQDQLKRIDSIPSSHCLSNSRSPPLHISRVGIGAAFNFDEMIMDIDREGTFNHNFVEQENF